MNEPRLRPASIAAAAVVIGGALVIAAPQHVPSILRLVIVAIAAAAGLYALAMLAPPAWWNSPFDGPPGRRARDGGADDVDWICSTLAGRRQRLDDGLALPPETLRLLQPLIRAALVRAGLDPAADAARAALPRLSRAVLVTRPLSHASWLRTLRPDPAGTASAVDRVLDEIDGIAAGAYRPHLATADP